MHFCLCHLSECTTQIFFTLPSLNLWLGRRDDTTKCWSLPFLEPLQSPCKSFEIFWNPNLFCCHMSPSPCKSFKIFWNLNILVAAGHIVCFECQPSLSRCPICNVRFRKILTRFASSSYHRCRCPTSRFSNSILLVIIPSFFLHFPFSEISLRKSFWSFWKENVVLKFLAVNL